MPLNRKKEKKNQKQSKINQPSNLYSFMVSNNFLFSNYYYYYYYYYYKSASRDVMVSQLD